MVLNRFHRTTANSDLLAAARLGDNDAWTRIYRNLIGKVTGYLARSGVTEPDDIAAEVFLQVARDLHRFEGDETSFNAWVFVIARRRMIDWRRATGRRPLISENVLTEPVGGNVEDEAIERLGMAALPTAFESLTDDQREVLALRVIADLSLEDTAKVMDKSVGAIKALQHRAIASIKRAIDNGEVTL